MTSKLQGRLGATLHRFAYPPTCNLPYTLFPIQGLSTTILTL